MSAGHVVVGRRGQRRSRAEVEALVAEYEASGVTRKAFCAGRGLSEATLDLYRKRAGTVRGADDGTSPLQEVSLPAAVVRLSVTLPRFSQAGPLRNSGLEGQGWYAARRSRRG
jgi:hypothetical protein